jgi:thymidylate synthase
MKILDVRNVHGALPAGLELLDEYGVRADSRNGPVLKLLEPCATVYRRPSEKLVMWPERDVNTAFLVYEALWMLAGRRDLKPLLRYVKTFGDYSDDGQTLHGAYGWRWRNHWMVDQLPIIARQLFTNQTDRRCVLAMWDPRDDLGKVRKDIPCNTIATFQVNNDCLDLTVFCRSNDIIWGAYFANAFHFAVLLEYMSALTKIPVGTYTQISVNYHAYEKVFEQSKGLWHDVAPVSRWNPYHTEEVISVPVSWMSQDKLDAEISKILNNADRGVFEGSLDPFFDSCIRVLHAHKVYSETTGEDRYYRPLEILGVSRDELILSMRQWIHVRKQRWESYSS